MYVYFRNNKLVNWCNISEMINAEMMEALKLNQYTKHCKFIKIFEAAATSVMVSRKSWKYGFRVCLCLCFLVTVFCPKCHEFAQLIEFHCKI